MSSSARIQPESISIRRSLGVALASSLLRYGCRVAQDPRVAGSRLAIWSHGAPHPTEGASTVLFWHYVSGLRAAGFEVLSVVLAEPDNTTPDSLREYEALARNEGIEVAICRADVVSRRATARGPPA